MYAIGKGNERETEGDTLPSREVMGLISEGSF